MVNKIDSFHARKHIVKKHRKLYNNTNILSRNRTLYEVNVLPKRGDRDGGQNVPKDCNKILKV